MLSSINKNDKINYSVYFNCRNVKNNSIKHKFFEMGNMRL